MVCVGLPSLKSGSRWRDGFDLARKLCFEDLLKSIIITIIQVTNVILVIAIITISFSLHILDVLSLNLSSVFFGEYFVSLLFLFEPSFSFTSHMHHSFIE